MKLLLRYAILAPSSHNTQPWKFSIGENEVRVFVDLARWLRIAGADKKELYIGIGCALENLLMAAKYFGFTPKVDYFPQGEESDLVSTVKLTT